VLPPLSALRPMLAVAGALPPPEAEALWAFEVKWDGVRALARVDAGEVRLVTRTGRDATATYPEVVVPLVGPRQVVLDGEIVAFDRGKPSFALLQRRMHVADPGSVARLVGLVPVTFLVFDVLQLDGRDLTGLPYDERRAELAALGLGEGALVPPSFPDGAELRAATRAEGLEGVVAKKRSSRYEPGRRSPLWVKVKNVRAQEVVLGGWAPGAGRRSGGIGALLLGVQDVEGLSYAGNVGTGFTAEALRLLEHRLRPLERPASPFVAGSVPRANARDAHWVRPELVGEVEFTEWTPEGRLRHPSWRGLRPDKSPADVVRE
jgi:bifunctional non-homologous end joining protein LigD